jgi:hypothetical protein
MDLKARIRSEYLDKLLSGDKEDEFRQFDKITLTDESGRSRAFEIGFVEVLRPRQVDQIGMLFLLQPMCRRFQNLYTKDCKLLEIWYLPDGWVCFIALSILTYGHILGFLSWVMK